jgi:hypothetical protein
MSNPSSTAERLAFCDTPSPAPSPARARIDAAVACHDEPDCGPTKHRLHGHLSLGVAGAIRITTQDALKRKLAALDKQEKPDGVAV